MASRQELRSEETKSSIITAARTLFAAKGYEAVTMREIAKEAKCSHTTIYIYFKDKEALLHALSMPALADLKQQLEQTIEAQDMSPTTKLKATSQHVIRFSLSNRNMYTIFFNVKAGRVDIEEPELEINKLRNKLFGLLMTALQQCLGLERDDERLLPYSRIYFFMLHGMVGTYSHSEEPVQLLLDRVSSTFDEAIEVMLAGFRYRMTRDEGMNQQ